MKTMKYLAAVAFALASAQSQADVVNGSFEAGLAGWTCGGDAANCSAIGAGGGGPIDGVMQALLQTETNPEGVTTSLSQTFNSDGNHIKFWWNFLTNEGTPSGFNDTADVTIDGVTYFLANTNSVFGPGDLGFNQQTGYSLANLPLGPGNLHTISFRVFDVGDDVVNSGLLVDWVGVPEPATLALLGLGLLGFGIARRRKQIA